MAVDPFQRAMFSGLRGPGPDPRLQGGIMGANQALQAPPVAAQPLQVASNVRFAPALTANENASLRPQLMSDIQAIIKHPNRTQRGAEFKGAMDLVLQKWKNILGTEGMDTIRAIGDILGAEPSSPIMQELKEVGAETTAEVGAGESVESTAARPLQVASLRRPASAPSTAAQPLKVASLRRPASAPSPERGYNPEAVPPTDIDAEPVETMPTLAPLPESESDLESVPLTSAESVEGTNVTPGNVETLLRGVDVAAVKAEDDPSIPTPPPEKLDEQRAKATELTSALTGDINTKDDFDKLIKALGGEGADITSSLKQAKELLGIGEDEADVPDWAAPMFLFGLNLMKGPVSSKVQGQTGLGGLLSDIGAAGEKGFAFFATERSRKRKEKAQIASVALQLQTADLARKKLLVSAYRDRQAAGLALDKAAGTAYNTSINRVLSLVPAGQEEKKVRGIHAFGSAWQQLKRAGVPGSQILKPHTQMLLESHAANKMGITKTPVELVSMNVGGIDLNYSPTDIEAARVQFNKDNPKNQIETQTEFLAKIVAKNPLVQKYQDLVIGARAEKVKDSIRTSVNKYGEEVSSVIITNEKERENWFANNPAPVPGASKEQKEAYAEKVRLATPTWEITTGRYLKSNPKYVEREFMNLDGTKTKFYINEAAFAARRRSDTNLTLQDVLLNPDKYPRILGGKVKDFSELQPNLENILVYDGGLKRTVIIDKNAVGRALAAGKIGPEEGTDRLIELGLARHLGEGVPIKPNEKVQIMKVVNGIPTITTIEAANATETLAAFTSKVDAKEWNQRQNSLITLNSTLWEIDKILTERGLGVTSSLTDFAGSAVTLARIAGSVFNSTGASRNRATLTNDVSGETRDVLNTAFGESTWKNLVENKEQRGALKSMFINLAFSLASSREGGKLTDNDVKNALETLGWEKDKWTLTPGQVLARAKVAARTANDSYINDALGRLASPEEKATYIKSQNEGKPDFVERLLQERAQVIRGVLQSRFQTDPEISLRYDRKDPSGEGGGQTRDGARTLIPVDESFEFNIPENNRGAFSAQVDAVRIPNTLRLIHQEVLFPGNEYSPVSNVRELATRIRSRNTAARLKALGLTEDQATEMVNKYLKFYDDRTTLFAGQ